MKKEKWIERIRGETCEYYIEETDEMCGKKAEYSINYINGKPLFDNLYLCKEHYFLLKDDEIDSWDMMY